MDSGYGTSGMPYEQVVAEAKTARFRLKKLCFLAGYIAWGAAVLIVGVIVKLILPLLCFIPLSIWIIVFLTWRYTNVEYEYSCFSGKMTVSKILGGRSRKKIAEITVKDLVAVFPYTDENVGRADAFAANKVYDVSSGLPESKRAERDDRWIALWSDGDERRMLCFEPDEKVLKFLRYYNSSAFLKN